MKKIITLSICILAFAIANSQEETDVYKQVSGNFSLELQLDPGAIFNSSNTNNFISSRGGLSDVMQAALSSFFNSNDFTSTGGGIQGKKFISESAAYRINVSLSFVQIEDVSGMEITLQPGYEKHFRGTKKLSPYLGSDFTVGFSSMEDTDLLAIGFGSIAGFDYYIAKKLYLGLELKYGLYYTKVGDIGMITFAPSVVNAIRIGFLF